MTQDVSSDSLPGVVAGDFSGATVRYGGVEALMHRDASGRFVMTFAPEGGGGKSVDAVVVRAVGSRRYQQYLAEVDGVLWRLPVAFHIEEKRWFHMNGAFLTPDPGPNDNVNAPAAGTSAGAGAGPGPGAGMDVDDASVPRFGGGAFDRHVTRWNDNCVFCHNVAPNPGHDSHTGAFRTSVAELGIACEACHGPGAEHVQVNQDPLRRYELRLLGVADPTIVNPSRLSPSRSADVCGRCHGQRMTDNVSAFMTNGDPFVSGDDLALYSAPLWRDTSLRGEAGVFASRFWDDGTPRLTAYEYQGLLQSRCAERGTLTCTTCHGMHDGNPRGQIRPLARGDRACTSCHVSLAATAAVALHTHHDPAGPGARCVSCHMPRIVYGVLDIHPSHRIEIPNPKRAITTHRPDACTLCHVDKDRAWAVTERAHLWPDAGHLGAARSGEAAPSDDHLSPRHAIYAGDPVVRAVAADAVGRAPLPSEAAAGDRALRARAGMLLDAMEGDRYPAVRHLAARALAVLIAAREPSVRRKAIAFEATGPAGDRARAMVELRQALFLPSASGSDALRIAALRADAAHADIDIGE